MRGGILWIVGTALAFTLTATAFLLLADLFATPPEKSLSTSDPKGNHAPPLDLDLNERQLAALDDLPNQRLDLIVRNRSDGKLSGIHLTLEVASENTALSEVRYYRATIEDLAAGAARRATFVLDLSPPASLGEAGSSGDLEAPQTIVEIRATTPEGVSAIRTVILPLQADS